MLLVFGVVFVVPGLALVALLHYLLSLPMQRLDRARLFLDLLETALDRGQPLEQAIISAAEVRDRAMGVRFFMLAAQIERGNSFAVALERTPNFLPPQVNAMLRSGTKLGDLKKVLPACREVVRVVPDTVRTTMHYMITILLIFAPVAIWLISTLSIFVIPKFKELAAGSGVHIWPITQFVFNIVPQLIGFELVLFLALCALAMAYLGGPGFIRLFQLRSVPLIDWIGWRVPWNRKKLLRTFSAMLAVLLDGGVPEAEAVRLAGESTANEVCRRRAEQVRLALQNGVKLDAAMRTFDDTGEFHWRLANAIHARGSFLEALRGWHEALDIKAIQQEETATHIFTSGLVVVNGVIVALIATAMFGILIAILKGALASS